MTEKQIRTIADAMMNKVHLVNMYKQQYENIREFPIYSELKGMEMVLKMMEIKFEYGFNDEVTEITSLTIGNYTAI